MRISMAAIVALVALVVPAAGLWAAPEAKALALAGMWEATVVANDVEVPFDFEIVVEDGEIVGSFFNGERKITSTEGKLSGNELKLTFGQYGTTLELKVEGNELEGEYVRSRGAYPFRASLAKAGAEASPADDVPSIAGTWISTANSNKGEEAWRFIARQDGAAIEGTILRVDGDTGTLSGSYRSADGYFLMSHFSGARPLRVEVTPKEDGTLALVLNGETELRAVRANAPEAAKIGVPTDPGRHTSVKDPSEPFRFSFPDLEGNIVSNTDARFDGKVVLVNVSGSWCPNCHDEAPFLASLYRRYRSQGLEIVSLSFEEAAQLENPERLRTFLETYGIEYTVLLAGEPKELAAKVPQAVNLNAFPTTFLLGRDGRVRAVHAGFPSPGSGTFYEEAEREITEQVELLLSEGATN